MTRLPTHWAVMTALVLLLSPVNAEAPRASGTAQGATISGPATIDGPLQGLVITDSCNAQGSGTASRLHIEVDSTHASTVVAGIPVQEPEHTTNATDYGQSTMAVAVHAGCRILALPTASGAAATLTAATSFQPADAQRLSFVPQGRPQRSATVIDTANAIQASASEIRMKGDFRLVVWEANLTISDAKGEHTLRTGATITDNAVPGTQTFDQSEAYIDFYGADLVLTLDKPVFLASAAANIAVAGEIRLKEARLTGQVTSDGGELTLSGPASVLARTQGKALALEIVQAAAVSVDGQAVLQPQPGRQAMSSVLYWAALAILGLLLAAELVRRRSRLHSLVEARRYTEAARLAHSIAWIPGVGRSARVAEAVALLRLERLEEAGAALGRTRRWRKMDPARQFLKAHRFAAQGDRKAARDCLAACLLRNPAYATDARADPLLRGIIDEAIRMASERRGARVEGYA